MIAHADIGEMGVEIILVNTWTSRISVLHNKTMLLSCLHLELLWRIGYVRMVADTCPWFLVFCVFANR